MVRFWTEIGPEPDRSTYRPEKPTKFADLLCPDVTGQRLRPRAIDPTRVSSRPYAAGLQRDRLSGVMERALKHKFPVGSTVYFTASNISRPAASGTYEVIRQLPSEGDDCQYRIKSSTEAFERVAKESQLAIS